VVYILLQSVSGIYSGRAGEPAPEGLCSDPSIGCIESTLVAPPHTVVSLKRCLCEYEGIDIAKCADTNLFLSASSRHPMEDDRPVSILVSGGIGDELGDPLALVVSPVSLRSMGRRAALPQIYEPSYGMNSP
jgi:hypothetical protein